MPWSFEPRWNDSKTEPYNAENLQSLGCSFQVLAVSAKRYPAGIWSNTPIPIQTHNISKCWNCDKSNIRRDGSDIKLIADKFSLSSSLVTFQMFGYKKATKTEVFAA
jgi:hypothetical protein